MGYCDGGGLAVMMECRFSNPAGSIFLIPNDADGNQCRAGRRRLSGKMGWVRPHTRSEYARESSNNFFPLIIVYFAKEASLPKANLNHVSIPRVEIKTSLLK